MFHVKHACPVGLSAGVPPLGDSAALRQVSADRREVAAGRRGPGAWDKRRIALQEAGWAK